MHYRRLRIPGGCYFFTVVTHHRTPCFNTEPPVQALRAAFAHVHRRHPFRLRGYVVLPDHLHCLWTLPDGDDRYDLRWRLIKNFVTRRAGYPVWQHRYWEHGIRDERDFQRHLDYIHYNPVKHGLAASPGAWRHSSFRHYVARGWYEPGWGARAPEFPEEVGE